jgi:hypothetical protein
MTQRFTHDVATTLGVTVAVDIGRYEPPDGYMLTLWWPGDGGTGHLVLAEGLTDGEAEAEFVALADDWSEQVFEGLAGSIGAERAGLWPMCPRHDHALDPEVVDERANWVCRQDKKIRIPIGSLAEHGSRWPF